MDASLLIALAGVALSVGTFFIGRTTSANKSGREWGELMSDIRNIKDDVGEMKNGMNTQTEKLEKSIAKVHRRLDDHLRRQHHMEPTYYGESE